MTNEEAKQFVSEVIQGLWPRWSPNKEEVSGWVYRLLHCDYDKSRAAVNNLFFASESRGIDPPVGKILKALRKQKVAEKREPVLLYTLVKEELFKKGRRKGIRFYGNKLDIDPRAIEVEAENMRENCNAMYRCNHIIIRNWENTGAQEE